MEDEEPESDLEGIMVVLETPRHHKEKPTKPEEGKEKHHKRSRSKGEKKEKAKRKAKVKQPEKETEKEESDTKVEETLKDEQRGEEEKNKKEEGEEGDITDNTATTASTEANPIEALPPDSPTELITTTSATSAAVTRGKERRGRVMGVRRQDIIQRPASIHGGSAESLATLTRRRVMSPPLDLTAGLCVCVCVCVCIR